MEQNWFSNVLRFLRERTTRETMKYGKHHSPLEKSQHVSVSADITLAHIQLRSQRKEATSHFD